jgi:hypothetical protein
MPRRAGTARIKPVTVANREEEEMQAYRIDRFGCDSAPKWNLD